MILLILLGKYIAHIIFFIVITVDVFCGFFLFFGIIYLAFHDELPKKKRYCVPKKKRYVYKKFSPPPEKIVYFKIDKNNLDDWSE